MFLFKSSANNEETTTKTEYKSKFPFVRPKESERKFVSPVIEKVIKDITSNMKDKDLARLFENCWPNTLGSAMWLRDSTNQIISYIPYAKCDDKLKNLILGVIYMQAELIISSKLPHPKNPWSKTDITTPPPSSATWEKKWELDSLVSFLKLSHNYWSNTKDDRFLTNKICILEIHTMQEFKNEAYKFSRLTRTTTETLMMEGIGAPVKRIGLVKSQFRPSDDSTTFPFLIPSNAFASVELSHLYEMIDTTSPDIAKKAKNLSQIIRDSIYSNAIIPHKHFENIFAYEIDGYGSSNLMDDANLPSLLSLPYFGFIDNDDKIYLKTRDFVLSDWNKFWFNGEKFQGVGSPHTGLGYIWPMSLCMKILTSTNDQEILETLELLKESSADTGLMHESFYYNDPNNYTRSWFAWANSLFGETILHLAKEKPDLIMIDDFKFIKLLDASK
ncbi:glycoside hydrolase family 125 protein [Rhizophagus irregularis DAOM 181602=DAOM 197198]|uniref:Glycoside hydrolase family 125 protein n=1 Tax=Rhizophagus irregularis (strain DAOM 181602 / DAOM 197198 / MUCL 43194) TaxID=747089 RepID=A0A2P4PRI0_RHIID|nr:glycoside hydrolase family 125 protein [Rhizophagus irregularis DAOM 181602=DAOM 197198]POG67998.1 glycoside hydrolase family 125 protein [Rhizophagus irregularis DAOM 181602=DAOM 197198]|eukprot:XP_025174864.1 glycoside hydrolase family 125 protein [Rhizophagus irregularis DAOM 181602=DAOM 197198]